MNNPFLFTIYTQTIGGKTGLAALLEEEVCAPVVAQGADGVDVFGIMHTNPGQMADALAILRRHWNGPTMAYPDSGKGASEGTGWAFTDALTPEGFVDACETWCAEADVKIFGVCCGLAQEHLEAMIEKFSA